MCLALDVLEGQNFAGVDHDGVVQGGSGAARLPAVDALDCWSFFFFQSATMKTHLFAASWGRASGRLLKQLSVRMPGARLSAGDVGVR